LYLKRARGRHVVVVDAGMNDLIRPALYGAYHEVMPIGSPPRSPNSFGRYDVVGPVCESADVLAEGRRLPPPTPGDFLAIMGAGAYGFTMASNYNGRLRPAEVFVRGRRWAVIRERETRIDLIRHEIIPKRLLK